MDYLLNTKINSQAEVSVDAIEATTQYGSHSYSHYKRRHVYLLSLFSCVQYFSQSFLNKIVTDSCIVSQNDAMEMCNNKRSLSSLLVYGSYHNLLAADDGGLFLNIMANK